MAWVCNACLVCSLDAVAEGWWYGGDFCPGCGEKALEKVTCESCPVKCGKAGERGA